MSETNLEKEVSEYAKLAKENPNIDVTTLMLNALNKEKTNKVSSKAKKWSYFISIGLPPIGLFLAIKYYFFSEEDDATTVGNWCVALTLIAIGLIWLIGSIMLSSSGTSLKQIEQIKPSDIQQLTQ